MVFGARRARAPRTGRALVIALVVLGSPGLAAAAPGGGGPTPDPGLSSRSISTAGTGDLVRSVRTAALRAATPQAQAATRILLIGTGVARALFPPSLQPSIVAAGADAVDAHGYGTLAASTILQLLPGARITSIRLGSHDGAAYDLVRLPDLRRALEHAAAERDRYDLVLLAYPPQGALDPIAHAIGHDRFGRYGTGLDLAVEALLSNPRGVPAIPADPRARDIALAGLNQLQREAVERYARRAAAWDAIADAVRALDAAGLPVVAPSGDYTRTEGERIVPLPTQTVFGLAAHPSVITVGASYADGGNERVSPTSGRGPTLTLGMKPDLVVPSDVMAMLPGGARLPWPDDGLRVPLEPLRWAAAPASPCPSVDGAYRCVLQGSSMVAASVAAANLAAAAAAGVAAGAGARADEVLRGLAWVTASRIGALASEGPNRAPAWERGSGVLAGLRGADPARVPVPLARADLGEASWADGARARVPLWDGGAPAAGDVVLDSFLGPDPSGAAIAMPHLDRDRVSASGAGHALGVRAAAGRYQGGVYAGDLTLTPPAGAPLRIPVSLTQTLPLDVTASYAYNDLRSGAEGERVEDASVVLFVGLPANVGLIGSAFKNLSGKAFKNNGGDPSHNLVVRHAVTKSSFDPGVEPAEHGTARIPAVPPGFYKIHLLTDHGVEAVQERGRTESLGIRLGSFGPEAAFVPGGDVLLPAQPPCGDGGAPGPLDPCLPAAGKRDPDTGFCTAADERTRVTFHVYCAPVAFAVPSAVVSRAVHLVEHDARPARSEWRTCGLDVAVDGTQIDFGALADRADRCEDASGVGTSWSFPAGAPGCLGPQERAAFPGGHPADVRAVLTSAAAPGVPGRAFPVAVLTYRFRLPSPNTYTTGSLSMSYVADNAIVGVRFRTGGDALTDAATSVLVVDEPGVSVTPAIERAPTAGSSYDEWAVMSADATEGQISIVVIPTAWVRADLDPRKPVASVQLCDVALRVLTFAKQSYGAPQGSPALQRFTTSDHGLAAQIDPQVARVRPVHRDGAFTDAGVERESLHLAVHIPKNTTRAPGAEHRVRSPLGGPAHLRTVAGPSGGSALAAGYRAHDPGYGVQVMDCARNPDLGGRNLERARNAAACGAWEDARAAGAVLAELSPTSRINGRFAGILALDLADVRRAQGAPAPVVADADDGGAFERRWARRDGRLLPRFTVPDFYDDAVPLPLSPLAGALSVVRRADGTPVLRVLTAEIGGASHIITAPLE